MATLLITLRVQWVVGEDGQQRVGLTWYRGEAEGSICATLDEVVHHLGLILEANLYAEDVPTDDEVTR